MHLPCLYYHVYIYSTYFLLCVYTRRAASSCVAEQYSGTHYISTIYAYFAHAIIIISYNHSIMYLLYIFKYASSVSFVTRSVSLRSEFLSLRSEFLLNGRSVFSARPDAIASLC